MAHGGWGAGRTLTPRRPGVRKRFNSEKPYPGVIEIKPAPLSGDTSWRINQAWWDHHRAINSTTAWWALRRNNAGWINWAQNKEWGQGEVLPAQPIPFPKIEGINSIGNYVNVLEVEGKGAKIETFRFAKGPPDPAKVNPKTHPWLFSEFHSISKKGEIGNAPDGVLSYFALVSKEGHGYLPLDSLEFVDQIPQLKEEQVSKMSTPRHWARGLDISKYDLRYDAAVRPVDFVIQRASYGLKRDERFDVLLADTRPVPIRGAYHYFNTGIPWRSQAEHFLNVVAGKGFHFLALDYETYYNNLNAASAEDARRIMEFWRAETGMQVLLYCNPNVYETALRPYGDWMAEWPLWISQWYSKWWFANRATGPKLPSGRDSWAFWQYGGDYQHPTGLWSVPGYNEGAAWGVGAKHVDLDLFNGSPAELRAWAGLDADEPTDPPPAPREVDIRLNEINRLEAYAEARRAELV